MIDNRILNGCAIKVIAYRIDPEQMSNPAAASASTTRGDFNYDISDLDLSSSAVFEVLAQNTSVRLPYDSGLCWNLNLKDDVPLNTNIAISASPLDSETREYYTKFEDMDAPKISKSNDPNRLELSWKNAFNMQSWQTRFTTYLKAKKKKLIDAYAQVDDKLKVLQEDVIRRKTADSSQNETRLATSNLMPAGMAMTVLTPYVISITHDISIQEVNNGCTIVFNSDPNATNSIAISTSGTKSLASPIDIYSTTGMPALYENDIIEVRVKYLSGYVPLPEEGTFIDSEGYYRTFMGFVTATSGSVEANGSQSLQAACQGIGKIFNLFTTTHMPSIAQVTDAPIPAVAVENGLEQSRVLMTIMENVYNDKTIGQIMKSVVTNILNGQESSSIWDCMNPLVKRDSATSIAPVINKNKPYDAVFYRQYLPKRSETSFMLMHQLTYNFYIARQLANIISSPTATRENAMADIFTTMERTQVKPYNAALAQSFNLYNTQFKSLSEVFKEISINTGHEIFEDSPGVLRVRPPKYNVLTLEPENLVFDPTAANVAHVRPTLTQALPVPDAANGVDVAPSYVIDTRDLKSISIDRDDTQLKTRADTNWIVPLAGKVVDNAQYYSDAGGLMRYGFRHIGPVQTPLASNMALAKAMSAIYLATANSTARTATITVFNNREYKAGRLYYIPLEIPDGYNAENKFNVVSRGVVGYVISKTENLSPNAESTCELRLAYLRVAEIMAYKIQGSDTPRYFANFKRLPDVDTFVRLTASNEEVRKSLATTNNSSEKERVLNSISVPLSTESVDLTNGLPSEASEDSESAIPQVKYYKVLENTLRKTSETSSAFDYRCGFSDHNVYTKQLASEVGSYKSLIAPRYADAALTMDRNLLAKLTIYDLDPFGKIYENISLGALGLINTHSTFYGRDTRDLMLIMHTAACHGFETFLRESVTALGEGVTCDKAVVGDAVNVITRPEQLAANLDVPTGWYDKTPGTTGILKLDSTLTLRSNLSNSKWIRFRIVTGLAENPILANNKYGLNPLCSCIFIRMFTTGYTGMPSGFTGADRLVVIPMPSYLSLRLSSLLSFGLVKYPNGNGKDGHTAGQAVTASDLVQTIWPIFPIIESAYEFKATTAQDATPGDEVVLNAFLQDITDLCRNPYNVRNGYGQSRSTLMLPWEKEPGDVDRQSILSIGVDTLGLPSTFYWASASTSTHGAEVTQLMRQGFEDVSCAVPISDSIARKMCAKLALQNQPTALGLSYPSLYVTLGKNFTLNGTTYTATKDTVFTMPVGRRFTNNLPPGLEQVSGTVNFEMSQMYGFLFAKWSSPVRGKSSTYSPYELLTGLKYISASKFACGIHSYTLANYEYVETYVNGKESALAKQISSQHKAIPSQVGVLWREYNGGYPLSFQDTDTAISKKAYAMGRLNLLRI